MINFNQRYRLIDKPLVVVVAFAQIISSSYSKPLMMITLLAEGENMTIFASPASRCEEVEVSKDPTHVAAAVYHQSSITTINRYFYYNETSLPLYTTIYLSEPLMMQPS